MRNENASLCDELAVQFYENYGKRTAPNQLVPRKSMFELSNEGAEVLKKEGVFNGLADNHVVVSGD